MAQFPATIQLSSLNGKNGFRLDGEAKSDFSGQSVASAGDVNGDGFADLIVGAPGRDYGTGTAYIVFGKESGFAAALNLSGLNGGNGFHIDGTDGNGAFGVSVSSAGDVNGDGFGDIIIGAPYAGYGSPPAGVSFVVFGKATGFDPNFNLLTLNGNNGFKLDGTYSDLCANSVASAGDINGDGFDDLIIGAERAFTHNTQSGTSFVVFGRASGFNPHLDLADLDGSNGFEINGELTNDHAGSSVASAGDFNGDGFLDMIIGASGADPNGAQSGAAYVVFGKASGFGDTLSLQNLNGKNGFQLNGVAPGDDAGCSVASAGDLNGDGFADVIVGAYGTEANGNSSGASYVVFGKASGFTAEFELSDLSGKNGFRIDGVAKGDYSGISVASAGDVNGDGFDDVIVGAYRSDPNGEASGSSYVLFGKAKGFPANVELSSLDGRTGFRIDGVTKGDQSGFSAASAGDVNGDGFADLIVGAYDADPHGKDSGSSYVLFARLPIKAVDRTGTIASQTLAGGKFDDTLSGLGGDDDLFGNGGDDALNGGSGIDTVRGGKGDDVLAYANASNSTGSKHDTVIGFDFSADHFDFTFEVTGVNDELTTGSLSTATFNSNLTAAADAAHLGKHHVVLFTPDGGTLSGEVFLIADVNNKAGYQAGKDLVIHLEQSAHSDNQASPISSEGRNR